MSNAIGRVITVVAAAGAAWATGAGVAAAEPETAQCERGELCIWPNEDYGGAIVRVALENANPGECVPLPEGVDGRSFANRTKRPVTVYQGHDCSTEGEFDTYPGGGTFVPEAPYLVRGVQIWPN
jgi:Peptidase inhibitor family I36